MKSSNPFRNLFAAIGVSSISFAILLPMLAAASEHRNKRQSTGFVVVRGPEVPKFSSSNEALIYALSFLSNSDLGRVMGVSSQFAGCADVTFSRRHAASPKDWLHGLKEADAKVSRAATKNYLLGRDLRAAFDIFAILTGTKYTNIPLPDHSPASQDSQEYKTLFPRLQTRQKRANNLKKDSVTARFINAAVKYLSADEKNARTGFIQIFGLLKARANKGDSAAKDLINLFILNRIGTRETALVLGDFPQSSAKLEYLRRKQQWGENLSDLKTAANLLDCSYGPSDLDLARMAEAFVNEAREQGLTLSRVYRTPSEMHEDPARENRALAWHPNGDAPGPANNANPQGAPPMLEDHTTPEMKLRRTDIGTFARRMGDFVLAQSTPNTHVLRRVGLLNAVLFNERASSQMWKRLLKENVELNRTELLFAASNSLGSDRDLAQRLSQSVLQLDENEVGDQNELREMYAVAASFGTSRRVTEIWEAMNRLPMVRLSLGTALLAAKAYLDLGEEKKTMGIALKDPTMTLMFDLGWHLFEQKKYEASARFLRLASQRAPNPSLRNLRRASEALEAVQDLKEGVAVFERILQHQDHSRLSKEEQFKDIEMMILGYIDTFGLDPANMERARSLYQRLIADPSYRPNLLKGKEHLIRYLNSGNRY